MILEQRVCSKNDSFKTLVDDVLTVVVFVLDILFATTAIVQSNIDAGC